MSNPYNLPPFKERLKETFYTYFKLGYTTFGGPAAHIAILYDEIVVKRKWVGDDQFTELFAICQALPGPASTELAYSLSLVRSGFICAVVAFLLWSMPGAIVMTVAGVLIGNLEDGIPLWATRLEQGLASAAIGLVALAAYRMSTSLATDKLTRVLALIAGGTSVLYTAPWLLPVLMIVGGVISYVFDAFLTPAYLSWSEKWRRRQKTNTDEEKDLEQGSVANEAGTLQDSNDAQNTESNEDKASSIHSSIRNRGKVDSDSPEDYTVSKASETASLKEKADTSRQLFSYSKKLGGVFLLIFIAFLVAAILVRALVPTPTKAEYGILVSTFYVVGSIIFGGGPVIIPLLKIYTVDSKWMTDQQFLVGLAFIQSLPGPNFNFACFLGAVAMINAGGNGVIGAILCFFGIFFPALILKNAIIPFWQFVRQYAAVKMVFRGVNACALGLVFSATWLLWVQTNVIGGSSGYHAVIASTAFVASGYLGIPAPIVILVGGGMGAIEYAIEIQ